MSKTLIQTGLMNEDDEKKLPTAKPLSIAPNQNLTLDIQCLDLPPFMFTSNHLSCYGRGPNVGFGPVDNTFERLGDSKVFGILGSQA